jgi:hypothetical protein
MKYGNPNKQSGFTVFEIVIGVAIFLILLNIVSVLASNYLHKFRIEQNANIISKVPSGVQRRNAHDGFLFSFWDENGGRVATGATLSWEADDLDEFLTDYLVGRESPACGNLASGWNPVNSAGLPDEGEPTSMERAELVDCNSLRGRLPYNIQLEAALSPEPNDSVAIFNLYLVMNDVNFGPKNSPENNILNYTQLQQALMSELQDNANGITNVNFGVRNNIGDIGDDVFYTTTECSNRLTAGDACDIIVSVDFAGTTNGLNKRTDNQDYFLDDVTFGQNVGGVRQTCAYWERDAAGPAGWSGSIVDCAIKAGVGDDDVRLVFDAAQAGEFIVTNQGPAQVDIEHLCPLYQLEDEVNNLGVLVAPAVPNDRSPCGILKDGNIVQLITDRAFVGRLYSENMIAESVYASKLDLFSNGNGDLMIQVFDQTQTVVVFLIDNNGNAIVGGDLDVDGDATFNTTASVTGTFRALSNAEFAMTAGSEVSFGEGGNSGIVMSRNGAGTFTIETSGVQFEILAGLNDQGIALGTNSTGDVEVRIKANNGIISENGTTFHSAKSTLRNSLFDAAGDGITTNEEKSLSELVTADMAKMLDDTSSPIQIAGVDRVEGAFTTLTKPDCLWFTEDANYSSPDANPYREIIDSGVLSSGESYARLILLPMYFKTYNSAFGDNQIYAQHASHSGDTTWDIYLYLSGEGAFGTGAREDGAGGSLAMTLCDYSSVDFSGQTF